jgi:large subunit ribosomal protein L4
MAKISVYNMEGKAVRDVELAPERYEVKVNPSLVHDVMVAMRANTRRSIAHTKTRGEVRGGGKKPWKQKGTGRARHGSIRSPIWIGGGITFGPRSERNFAVKVNKKLKQKAMFMILSDKVASNKLFFVDPIKADVPKTKIMATLLEKLPIDRTVLLVTNGPNPELLRMVRNLQHVKLVTVNSVSLLDLLRFRTVIFEEEAFKAFDNMYV